MSLKLGGSLADQVRRSNPPNELRLPSSDTVGGVGAPEVPAALAPPAARPYLATALACRCGPQAETVGRGPVAVYPRIRGGLRHLGRARFAPSPASAAGQTRLSLLLVNLVLLPSLLLIEIAVETRTTGV